MMPSKRMFFLLIAALLVPVAATVAWASGDSPAAVHGPAKPALLEWDFGTAFWSVIVFVVLLVVLRGAAWKPILNGLHQRERFITDSIENAQREREAAAKQLAEYTAKIEKARLEATEIVDEGRRDAEEVRKRVHGEARAEADAMIARARKDLALARDDAVKQIYDQAINLATQAAGKIVGRELKADDHKRLLDESLAELSKLGA